MSIRMTTLTSPSAAGSASASMIHVCSLSRMPAVLGAIQAARLVTIINPRMMPDTPATLPATAHLKIACSDICEPAEGRVCPQPEHVAALIGFVRDWNHHGPLLIHCLAGISRSTAAAYIGLCALNEDVCEREIAGRLRAASASAMPNRLLVGLADSALGRSGRMLEAIAAMGSATLDAHEGEPFSLPSRFTSQNLIG